MMAEVMTDTGHGFNNELAQETGCDQDVVTAGPSDQTAPELEIENHYNPEPTWRLSLGEVAPGFGMMWDVEFRYQIKIKPDDYVEIIGLDVLTPDEANVIRKGSFTLPSGEVVLFDSCRTGCDDDETQHVSIPRLPNGAPGLVIAKGVSSTISVRSVDDSWRSRAIGGSGITPIQACNSEEAPVQFEVKCTVPKYGDALCPIAAIYYKKTKPPPSATEEAILETQSEDTKIE